MRVTLMLGILCTSESDKLIMNQCYTSSKIADKHVKWGKKTESVERAGVWVHVVML